MRKVLRRPTLGFRVPNSIRQRFCAQLRVEQLEARTLLSANPLSPAQIRHAYGFDQLGSTGAGQTIAIVDAYDHPNVYNDLNVFDRTYSWNASGPTLYSQFGASSSFLTTATPQGQTRGNSGWAQEISLDVEWAHAIAPAAHILLVEAQTASVGDLLGAVDYAAEQPGVVAVSMSWGTGEFSSETALDSHFNHPGITFVAAAGDAKGTQWPAVSPNVVAVGGRSLTVDSTGNYRGETAWNNQYGASGGGFSTYEPRPSYQSAVARSSTQRSSPDVSYNADPATGVAVYDSYASGGGWGQYGGTSAGAPQWAALIALADQGRTTKLSSSGTLTALYNAPCSTNFHNVTGNGATTGYDLAAGLGSPRANALISYLSGLAPSVSTPLTSISGKGATGKKPMPPAPVQPAVIYLPYAISLRSSYAVINSPAVRIATTNTPLPNPVTVVPPVFAVRQESGGGDSELPPDTNVDQKIDIPGIPPIVPGNDAMPAPDGQSRVPVDRLPLDRTGTVGSWREACTACFESDSSLAGPQQATVETSAPSLAADGEPVAEPAAALIGMAFVLGGYWGRQAEDAESDKHRRTNAI
jgi:subtilase family serine protease